MIFLPPKTIPLFRHIIFTDSLLSRNVPPSAVIRGSFVGTTSSPLSRSFVVSSRSSYIAPRQHRHNRSFRDAKFSTDKPTVYTSQVSFTYLLATVFVVIAGGWIAATTLVGESNDIHEDTRRKVSVVDDNMAPLPGRVGNLTPEEEIKLKQFWRMTFNVTGVDIGEAPPLPDTASTINDDLNSVAGDKKKKGGLFGRKSKNETKAPEEEDKYGQTKEYQEALATISPDEFRRAFWKNSKNEHPDAILLRFLRARKWDLQKALVMMISTLQWRAKTMNIEDSIVLKGELAALEDEQGKDPAASQEGRDFLNQMRKGKSYVHGVDREGRPVTWVRVRLHHGGEQSVSSIEKFTVHIFETTRLLINPAADTGDLFFDMTGFGIANMDYTPVKFMIKCFEANYPESLGLCIIYKAPWIFQGFWKIISRWLDPVVASKIHFANNIKDLDPYVDRSQIPQEMGGDSPYVYQYIEPRKGENDPEKDAATRKKLEDERAAMGAEFERLTIEWVKGANVNAQRQQIAAKMREEYWKLDPYVRGRSLYDRLGVLSSDGKVDWSRALHPVSEKPATGASGPVNGAAKGPATGAVAAVTTPSPVAKETTATRTVRPAEDSDNESLASFKTGHEIWDDEEQSASNGTAAKSLPNGTVPNGTGKVGATAAGVLGAITSVVVGNPKPAQDRSPTTPTTPTKLSLFPAPTSPTKSIRSYVSIGTQTWNPRDASTQTMPLNSPIRSR